MYERGCRQGRPHALTEYRNPTQPIGVSVELIKHACKPCARSIEITRQTSLSKGTVETSQTSAALTRACDWHTRVNIASMTFADKRIALAPTSCLFRGFATEGNRSMPRLLVFRDVYFSRLTRHHALYVQLGVVRRLRIPMDSICAGLQSHQRARTSP